MFYWRKTKECYEKRFLTELQTTLLREVPKENKWEKQALGALGEIVEFVTLQRGLEYLLQNRNDQSCKVKFPSLAREKSPEMQRGH